MTASHATGRECLRCTLHYGRHRSSGATRAARARARPRRHVHRAQRVQSRQASRVRISARHGGAAADRVRLRCGRDQCTCVEPASAPVFLLAGRLERIKGLDDVLPLFRDADAPADLLIAGAGSHEAALRAIAGESPRIRFLGHLTPDRLAPLYRHAIAHIAPSVCFETFGNTLVESFRQRTPVIARNIGPFPEIVTHAGGGVLFDDADGLALGAYPVRVGPRTSRPVRRRWAERV